MEKDQVIVDDGHLLTQVNGMQIIAYERDEDEIEYLYLDMEDEREVLRTKENLQDGLISILDLDRDFWELTFHGMKLNKPYKIIALVEDRVLHITPV